MNTPPPPPPQKKAKSHKPNGGNQLLAYAGYII